MGRRQDARTRKGLATDTASQLMGFKLGCTYRMTVLQFSLLQYRVSTGEIQAPRSSPGSGRGSVHPQP